MEDRLNYLMGDLGLAIAPSSLRFVVDILSDSVWDGTPAPIIGLDDEGTLAVEFRGPTVELQFEVDSGGAVSAFAARRGVTEWEGPFDELPDGVEKWAWRLAQDLA